MSRRRAAQKREIAADPQFGNIVVSKFINNMMMQGKKSTAEAIFYEACDRIKKEKKADPLEIFEQAMDNVRPVVEVRSRRVGGATYQVPVQVNPGRAQALAIRWLIGMSRKRSEKTMEQRLAGEFFDASQGKGGSVKKREDIHKMADANKAFAHYRW